ncbi:undecaprenyldiphospho-muramoylpentapeptide beta-N-acetylglucosaminyltransferase [bacterium]|nr:undecaprenyldiphospho-muramoylpentapeptide beta-N-acetylglucosaminyltransferase [bacterium]
MDKTKIIIAGGGTGGHLFPAIAIGEEIKERIPDAEIHFIGSTFGLESKVFPVKDLIHTLLPIRGLQRSINIRNILKNFFLPFRIIRCLIKVNSIYKDFNPRLVIGTGGYASAVPLFVAVTQNPKIPIILQEQNSFPGITTRWFAKKSSLICSAFNVFKDVPDNEVILTGNPIRSTILNGKKEIAIKDFNLSENKKTLFIFGGSQGSRFLNDSLLKIVRKINFKNTQIIWQTGDKDFRKYNSLINKNLKIVPFINDMASAYALSDLVVCRSGALTLSELTACGKPSILIPFAAAAGNHQLKNAIALEKNKAAVIIEEKDMSTQILLSTINNLINNDATLKKMSKASKNLGNPHATKTIVDSLFERNYFV